MVARMRRWLAPKASAVRPTAAAMPRGESTGQPGPRVAGHNAADAGFSWVETAATADEQGQE